jgi:hypothetical protein
MSTVPFYLLQFVPLIAAGLLTIASLRLWRTRKAVDSGTMLGSSGILLVGQVYSGIADHIRLAPHVGQAGAFSYHLNWFDLAFVFLTPVAMLAFGIGFLLFVAKANETK